MSRHNRHAKPNGQVRLAGEILNLELQDRVLVIEALDGHILDVMEPELHQVMIEDRRGIAGPLERVEGHVHARIIDRLSDSTIPVEADRAHLRVMKSRPITESAQNLLVSCDALVWRAHVAEQCGSGTARSRRSIGKRTTAAPLPAAAKLGVW